MEAFDELTQIKSYLSADVALHAGMKENYGIDVKAIKDVVAIVETSFFDKALDRDLKLAFKQCRLFLEMQKLSLAFQINRYFEKRESLPKNMMNLFSRVSITVYSMDSILEVAENVDR